MGAEYDTHRRVLSPHQCLPRTQTVSERRWTVVGAGTCPSETAPQACRMMDRGGDFTISPTQSHMNRNAQPKDRADGTAHACIQTTRRHFHSRTVWPTARHHGQLERRIGADSIPPLQKCMKETHVTALSDSNTSSCHMINNHAVPENRVRHFFPPVVHQHAPKTPLRASTTREHDRGRQ